MVHRSARHFARGTSGVRPATETCLRMHVFFGEGVYAPPPPLLMAQPPNPGCTCKPLFNRC